MKIRCECGKFQAELTAFPKNTPGRLKCYCDDCQTYMHALNRPELLDINGGTEIIPVYPSEMHVTEGIKLIKCLRLSKGGPYRYSTICCNTPVANTAPDRPWMGIFSHMFAQSLKGISRDLPGPIRASIMGKFAKGIPPKGTLQTFNLRGFLVVMPHLLKGKLLGKAGPSPFFTTDGWSLATPQVLTLEERRHARMRAGF